MTIYYKRYVLFYTDGLPFLVIYQKAIDKIMVIFISL